MRTVDEYIDQINHGLCYRPGCTLRAIDWSIRHGGAILVQVTEQTHDFSQRYAPNFDDHGTFDVKWYFAIVPEHYNDEISFWRSFWNSLQKLQSHENRECFRLFDGERWVGIFNPHEPNGQKNFGDPEGDLAFGDLAINSAEVEQMFNQVEMQAA